MKYQYLVYKLKNARTGMLVLWDGPGLPYAQARRTLKKRQADNPGDKFFLVRLENTDGWY